MAPPSPSLSVFASGLAVALLLGCGPRVKEDDRFVEEQCDLSCDRLDECGRYFDDREQVCADIHTWEPQSCEDVTATYLECLRQLTCEESAARAETIENGQGSLQPLPCDEEMLAASRCAS